MLAIEVYTQHPVESEVHLTDHTGEDEVVNGHCRMMKGWTATEIEEK